MYETGKSYPSIEALNPPNNDVGAIPTPAKAVEQREVPKWNLTRDSKLRAQLRVGLQEKLGRIRQQAAMDKQMRFTTLWHHVYDLDRLSETFFSLRKDGAVGIDEVDWVSYAENLEDNLRDLSAR